MKSRVVFAALAAFLFVVTGCRPGEQSSVEIVQLPTLAVSETPIPLDLDSAERVALTFLEAWGLNDFETMYSLVSLASQQATPFDSFVALYQASHAEMSLLGLGYHANALAPDPNNRRITILNYDVTFETYILGAFTDANRSLQLVQTEDAGGWRVAWTPGDIFAEMGRGGLLRLEPSVPRRASIYDREGEVLADQNGVIVTVNVVRSRIPDTELCLNTLSQAGGVSVEALRTRLNLQGVDWLAEIATLEPATFTQWESALTRDCAAQFGRRSARRYINGSIAPHVIGTVGYPDEAQLAELAAAGFPQDAIIGRTGIEASWDELLRGGVGGRLSVVTPDGVPLRIIAEAASRPAQSVYLTIEVGLQLRAIQAVQNAYITYGESFSAQSRGGAVVVMDVNTGAILALVSWPTYDANALAPFSALGVSAAVDLIRQYTEDPRIPLLNRVTQGRYPPGSTFKVVTSMAAADSGVYALDERYTCSGLWQRDGDRRVDWLPGGHGLQTLAQAITHSCNPYFYEAGYQLNLADPALLPRYARQVGFGGLTGLTDLEESAGFIGDPEWARQTFGFWSFGDAVSMAIGQGFVEVTPLQMVRLFAAIANGGTLYRPQLVDRAGLVDEFSYVMTADPNGSLGVSPDVLAVIREGLCNVTSRSDGTAEFVFRNSPLQALGVCGKTGTASDQSPTAGPPHAWFAAYAPRDNPQIAVVALLENAGQGSELAAPIVRDIMEYFFFGSAGRP